MEPVSANLNMKRLTVKRGRSILALAFGLAVCFPIAAQAQYYGYGYGRGPYGPYGAYGGPYGGPGPYDPYDDDMPPVPSRSRPLPVAPRSSSEGPSSGSRSSGIVPLDVIVTKVRAAGYKLIAPPRQKGNIYLAEAEDSKAIRHRLVYDSIDGHLIENTALGPVKKPGAPAPGEAGKEPEQAKAATLPAGQSEKHRLPMPPADEPPPPAAPSPSGANSNGVK